MSTELIELVQRLGQPRVVVVGDVMLDRYVWGDAERISQEAPVILLRADRREERLGGASSVATMLQALGAQVSLIGVVGMDADAQRVRDILDGLSIDMEGVVTDSARPTTVKERYIGRAQHRHPQQMLRVDFETREPLSDGIEQDLASIVSRKLKDADIVLISDYDKGVCTPGLLAKTIAFAKALGLKGAELIPFAARIIANTSAVPPSHPTASKPAWRPAGPLKPMKKPSGPAATCWGNLISKRPS